MATGDSDAAIAQAIAQMARPLCGSSEDLDPLIELVGDARCVLVGEATHGTHEFYRLRAQLTKRLVTEKGFCAVAAEADWPDAQRVNRFVRGLGTDVDAVARAQPELPALPRIAVRTAVIRLPMAPPRMTRAAARSEASPHVLAQRRKRHLAEARQQQRLRLRERPIQSSIDGLLDEAAGRLRSVPDGEQ